MNNREEYFFNQVVENFNTLFLNYKLMTVERDTLLTEVNNLKEELGKTYRELAEVKGFPANPGMEYLAEKMNIPDLKVL